MAVAVTLPPSLLDALSNAKVMVNEADLKAYEKKAAMDAGASLAMMGRHVSFNSSTGERSYVYPEAVRKDAELMAYNVYEPSAGLAKPANFATARDFLKRHEPTARQHAMGGQLADAMKLSADQLSAAIDIRKLWEQQEADRQRNKPGPGPQPPPKPPPSPGPQPGPAPLPPPDDGGTTDPVPVAPGWSWARVAGWGLVATAVGGIAWSLWPRRRRRSASTGG